MNAFFWAGLTALTWGLVPMIEKCGLAKLPPQVGLFYRSWGVIVGMVILFLMNSKAIRASWQEGTPPGLALLVFGGFLASIVGQIFFYNALKTGELSRVVPVAAAYPLISFLLGVLFFGEQLSWAKAGGLALVIGGVILLK